MTKNLVLKVTNAGLTTRGGFQWPSSGYVEAPDWKADPNCGHGLHGWLNGEGVYVHTLNHPTNHKWLVIEPDDTIVTVYSSPRVKHKAKFKSGNVVYCGDKVGAIAYMITHGAITADSDIGLVCLTPAQCATVEHRANARNVDANPSNNYVAMACRFAVVSAVLSHRPRPHYDGASLGALSAAFQAAATCDTPVNRAAAREAYRLDKLRAIGVVV